MAFKRKEDTGGGEEFKFDKKGKSLTGIYMGSSDFKGKFAPTKKHIFKTESGIKVVFGQSHLIQLLADEQPGILVCITYVKDKPSQKGNPMKVYTLDIDDEFRADEDEIAEAVDAANSDEQDDEPEEDEEELAADEVKTEPVKTRPAAKAPTKSSTSRVQELLAKRSRTA